MVNEPDDDERLQMYLTDIEQYPRLTSDQDVGLARAIEASRVARAELEAAGHRTSPAKERELRRIARSGEDAEGTLIQSHLHLVVSIVNEYRRSGVQPLDLIQEDNMGLMESVSTFDWRGGTDFASHATPWIRQAIASFLEE